MSNILDFFGQSEALVGVLLGGMIGIATTWLGLRHQSKEARRQRQFELKSQVFLETIAALERVRLKLAKLEPEPLQTFISSSTEVPEVLAKAELVGSTSTQKAIFSFNRSERPKLAQLIKLKGKIDCLGQGNLRDSKDELAKARKLFLDRKVAYLSSNKRALGKVILAMRQDLGIPSDENEYHQELLEDAQHQEETIRRSIAESWKP